MEHKDGRDPFINGVRASAQNAMRYALANPESTIVHKNLSNISQVIANNAQVYQGGAQVLHMLRGVLGSETFWQGIRLYYARFQNRNASTDDFRIAIEEACSASTTCSEENRDLKWFFDQWLNRGGILQITGSWSYDAAARQLRVVVDQTQKQGLYRMPIEIGVTLPPGAGAAPRGGGTSPAGVQRIIVDKQRNELVIPMESAPADVKLDPNSWVTMMQGALVRK
jgi:aminopeptidase N